MDFTTAFRSAADNADDARTRQLALNLAAVHERIDKAVGFSGRADRPELIVVTKYFPPEDVQRLFELGVRDVGENKDQEAAAKAAAVTELLDDAHPSTPGAAQTETALRWHFIGQLQTNKAKSVVRYADSVHSADRSKLINALNNAAVRAADEGTRSRPLEVLLQVDLRSPLPDDHRGGAAPTDVLSLAELIASAEQLHLGGLMAVAPLDEDPEPAFARLGELSQLLSAEYPEATQISAGMSQDLEAAVNCGATRLRIGRDVLGERPHH
ncbi:YggS family pyridoxal phosphate-dependent enzyme [Nesterenkonia haasae]|uniref:YggS family pyridoxal phosphate-dependent enzyme n=1 Tax=Nesterenkonia haasae TaxID=2587813 RepID=UPI001391EB0C|nr:YggS family pyridoxal phosphate-dependent enzyme [Nesterenkonia haasae]NDK32281.1 YggS family pyridoxal phosphate-dependent enzyme [Nesterenkonia haasae]